MRGRVSLGFLLACACAGGNSLETTGAFTTLAPGTSDGGATDGGTDTASSSDTGGGTADVSTGSGPGTTSAESSGSTSTGASAESSSAGPLPPQPGTGWWSHCTSNEECMDDLFCITDASGLDGMCTSFCDPAGAPTSCGASPGVSAAPSCLNLGGTSLCALDCAGGTDCPGGMLCLSDTDDDGPIEICL